MSIIKCDKHGHWDSDQVETCPLCDYGGIDPMQKLIALIADDSFAITFQSMGQYRSALLASTKG